MAPDEGFRERVVRHYSELPPQQQAIADFLLEHLDEAPFLSLPELAERSGASEATIVRFAQRVGYEGFAELRFQFLEALRQRVQARPSEASAGSLAADVLSATVHREAENLRRTLDGLDRERFREAATAIFKADHVFVFGLGISAYLADLAQYLLTEIGLRATALSARFSSPLEQAVAFRASDLLLAFSFPPYSKPTVEMIERLAERGIPAVALTDRITSPAARAARFALAARSDNLLFTNAVGAATVVVNALVTEIAVRHQGRTLEALAEITRLFAANRDVLASSE